MRAIEEARTATNEVLNILLSLKVYTIDKCVNDLLKQNFDNDLVC